MPMDSTYPAPQTIDVGTTIDDLNEITMQQDADQNAEPIEKEEQSKKQSKRISRCRENVHEKKKKSNCINNAAVSFNCI